MFRALLIILCLSVAACKPASENGAAFTDSRLPPGLGRQFWPPEGWAWGLLQLPGRPALRYGVAAPRGEARADVIILPGHGESAEMWFETANALLDRNYAVWILEGAGEGGSGRYGGARDQADAPDFEADIRGLIALDRRLVKARRQVAVLAAGTAAYPAMAAVQRGYQPHTLILSGPFDPGPDRAWKRPQIGDKQPLRERALGSWATANPDLRMGGVTTTWSKAYSKLKDETLSPVALGRLGVKVLVIAQEANAMPCERMPACRQVMIASNEPYPVSANTVHAQWLGALSEGLPN